MISSEPWILELFPGSFFKTDQASDIIETILESIMVEIGKEPRCANCPMRLKAEEKPNSILSRIWRWHTTWCPGWKAYQESLEKQGE